MQRIGSGWLALGGALAIVVATTGRAQMFEPPVRLTAEDKAIDVEIGHAAPYLYDFDRDGKRDLLVGQFKEGKLRIYRNLGTNAQPKYGAVEWFTADGEVVKTSVG
ncbi:MAG: hypothetical protein ACKVX7_06405 [Planctomycetota bacterium]